MAELVLVRHAMPELRPDVPAQDWLLGSEGRAAARALARVLPRQALTLTSGEPKARQTAEEIVAVCNGTLAVDARVGETRRPDAWEIDYRRRAHEFVAGCEHAGWESRVSVAGRFDAAVRAGLRTADRAPLIVVSHGQALTLWLESIGAVEDAPRFWEELSFPDAWQLGVRSSGEPLEADPPIRLS
jgi:broad specificity phosphatase PhoE